MDATEAQLRFGVSLTHATDPSHPLHPLNSSQPQTSTSSTITGLNSVLGGASQTRTRLIDPNAHSGSTTRIVGFSSNSDNQRNFDRDNYAQSSRREFLTYALSLMRSHSSEHRDSLPVLDVTSLRHIAYVVDSIVYYMRSSKESDDKSENNYWMDADENENEDTEDDLLIACVADEVEDEIVTTGNRHVFFQRSESTLCLGCPPPDPFNLPLKEALPLADQPHLLQPNANREDLFGIPKQPVTISSSDSTTAAGTHSPLELPPTRLGLSSAPRPLSANYETQFTESNATENEQTISIEVEEKSDKIDIDATASTSKETVTPTSNASAPSASRETSGGRRQPENFNIYMHLKKKTYFDFQDDETKSNNAVEKRDEEPQDLSKSTGESSSAFVKMDLDDSDAMDTEIDVRGQAIDQSMSTHSDEAAAVRPQIIVSPRKNFGESSKTKSNADDENGANNSSSNSPSKSVIVRAGPSVSLSSDFLSVFFLLLRTIDTVSREQAFIRYSQHIQSNKKITL